MPPHHPPTHKKKKYKANNNYKERKKRSISKCKIELQHIFAHQIAFLDKNALSGYRMRGINSNILLDSGLPKTENSSDILSNIYCKWNVLPICGITILSEEVLGK